MASASVIIVVALVLAPGLHSAVVQTGDLPSISNYPQAIHDNVQILPELIEVPVFRPLPLPVPVPEVALPELAPAPLRNPCDACFSYMTALIDQLATVPEIQPHPMPEVGSRPLPEFIPIVPLPVQPEFIPLPLIIDQ
ncbi:uncharacterized protein LOC108910055 [Anoplophora glabripennis]|uniref:uncharacterized protein LOC108910055 n=1 Tax=Anoplophora glabripennis TaxID=217634 RepID=UPI000874CB78|nr:uncharacterized protein LOC108910055 [Anoplophora glabripennis]